MILHNVSTQLSRQLGTSPLKGSTLQSTLTPCKVIGISILKKLTSALERYQLGIPFLEDSTLQSTLIRTQCKVINSTCWKFTPRFVLLSAKHFDVWYKPTNNIMIITIIASLEETCKMNVPRVRQPQLLRRHIWSWSNLLYSYQTMSLWE